MQLPATRAARGPSHGDERRTTSTTGHRGSGAADGHEDADNPLLREYRSHAASRAFIRHSRELGFPLEAIRELLTLADDPDQSCEDADRIATEQLAAVRRRISRLRALETELQRMTACRHTSVAECRVIEVLGNHDLCENEHHGDAESLTIE